MSVRKAFLAVPSLLLAVALTACGGDAGAAPTGPDGPGADTIAVPETLGGLRVVHEKKATKEFNKQIGALSEETSRAYVTDGVAYSLRQGKELKAVLQASRLTPDAKPEERDFRRDIVNQIGRGKTSPETVGEQLVYVREGNQQVIYVWFEGRFLFVLLVRADGKPSATPVDPEAVLADALAIEVPAA